MNLVYILIVFSLLYVLQMFFNKNLFLKLIVITYLFITSSAIFFSFETYKGWPSGNRIEKAILINVQISEPSDNNPGAIYLWVYDEPKPATVFSKIFGYTPLAAEPRSYVIPYSKNTKQKFEEAMKQIEMGMTVELSGSEPKQEAETQGEGNVAGQEGTSEKEVTDYDVPSLKIIPPDQILRKQ